MNQLECTTQKEIDDIFKTLWVLTLLMAINVALYIFEVIDLIAVCVVGVFFLIPYAYYLYRANAMNRTKRTLLETAQHFHDVYEELSPQFNYTTRLETRVFDPDSPNGKLMIATIERLVRDGIITIT